MTDEGEEVPLYEDNNESSNILALLKENDEVIVIETLDDYSLIKFIIENENEEELSNEILTGYIDNNNLRIENELTEETDNPIEESESEQSNDKDNESTTDSSVEQDTETIQKEDNLEQESNQDEENEELESEQSRGFTVQSARNQTNYQGIALKNKTHVYKEQSREKGILKSYDSGTILKYRSLNANWYEATVFINGKSVIGYIHNSDVEAIIDTQDNVQGIALQAPTHVYSKASTDSKSLKSYSAGSILKYRTFTANWYQATVYINGKATTGYIHKSHVENAVNTQQNLQGIGLKNPTHVYANASTSSKSLRSYSAGTVLKYRTFTDNWYQATVYINGKATTGYIHKSHVENVVNIQQNLQGIGLKNPTHVYANASTSSKSLKSYSAGTILKYRTFTNNWYEATVYVNGKATTGYIHKSHVENVVSNPENLYGVALQAKTNVYSSASTGSKILRSYSTGSILKYKSFTTDWYQATVYINGKPTTGYIHKSHVGKPKNQVSHQGIGLQNPTHIYKEPFSNSTVLKSYNQGSVLKYKTYGNGWYEATVYIDGTATSGYIRSSHVENAFNEQKQSEGFALKDPTHVYTSASRNSKSLKSYSQGSVLKFKTFSSNWHEATVIIDGKGVKGFIHVDDVGVKSINYKSTKYDISLDEATAAQMKAFPKTSYSTMYVHKDALKKNEKGAWVVSGTGWNVRSGPGTDYPVIGKIDERYINDPITVHKTVGDFYHFSTWILATEEDTKYYLDPQNFPKGSNSYYQFLVLSESAGVNINEVNTKILYDKGIFRGKAAAFIEAANTYNINELYLISHALLETGNGTSDLAQGGKYNGITVYNMYGIGARDSCESPYMCGLKFAYDEGWTTPEKAIIGGAKFIADRYINVGQDTLYKMRWNPDALSNTGNASHQYATDIGWAVKQTSNLTRFYELLDTYKVTFDQPTYK